MKTEEQVISSGEAGPRCPVDPLGIVPGYSPGRFAPHQSITQAWAERAAAREVWDDLCEQQHGTALRAIFAAKVGGDVRRAWRLGVRYLRAVSRGRAPDYYWYDQGGFRLNWLREELGDRVDVTTLRLFANCVRDHVVATTCNTFVCEDPLTTEGFAARVAHHKARRQGERNAECQQLLQHFRCVTDYRVSQSRRGRCTLSISQPFSHTPEAVRELRDSGLSDNDITLRSFSPTVRYDKRRLGITLRVLDGYAERIAWTRQLVRVPGITPEDGAPCFGVVSGLLVVDCGDEHAPPAECRKHGATAARDVIYLRQARGFELEPERGIAVRYDDGVGGSCWVCAKSARAANNRFFADLANLFEPKE